MTSSLKTLFFSHALFLVQVEIYINCKYHGIAHIRIKLGLLYVQTKLKLKLIESNQPAFVFFLSYKQYLKSRPGASVESVRRIKTLKLESMGIHPLLSIAEVEASGGNARDDFLLQMKKFRPSTVNFHLISGGTKKVINALKLRPLINLIFVLRLQSLNQSLKFYCRQFLRSATPAKTTT